MLGAAVWIWMNSPNHQNAPLHALATDLLPAIKCRQFLMALENGKPVFFLSWANFSEEAERRYLRHETPHIPEKDWNSGDRIWFIDWIAPFGQSARMSRLLASRLFADKCGRSLYHRGNDKGLRIMHFHGIAVLPEEARYWFDRHPAQIPERMTGT